MIVPIHANEDSEEFADCGHPSILAARFAVGQANLRPMKQESADAQAEPLRSPPYRCFPEGFPRTRSRVDFR